MNNIMYGKGKVEKGRNEYERREIWARINNILYGKGEVAKGKNETLE